MVKDLSRRFSFLTPIFSKRGLAILALLFIAFLTSGGIYAIISNPPSSVSTSSGSSYIYNSATAETSSELFVTFLLTVTGAAGFILLEAAFKKSYDLSDSRLKYMAGIVLVIIAISLLEVMVYIKLQ